MRIDYCLYASVIIIVCNAYIFIYIHISIFVCIFLNIFTITHVLKMYPAMEGCKKSDVKASIACSLTRLLWLHQQQ